MKDYSMYIYYKGEKEDPFMYSDNGKSAWWRIESYAARNNDKKERDKLSSTMLAYIREWHWQNESNLADITWEESVERATESYLKGKFNSSYLSVKECGIDGYANDHPERLAYLEFLKTLPTEDEAELNPNLTSKEIAELYLAGDDIYGIHDSAYFD